MRGAPATRLLPWIRHNGEAIRARRRGSSPGQRWCPTKFWRRASSSATAVAATAGQPKCRVSSASLLWANPPRPTALNTPHRRELMPHHYRLCAKTGYIAGSLGAASGPDGALRERIRAPATRAAALSSRPPGSFRHSPLTWQEPRRDPKIALSTGRFLRRELRAARTLTAAPFSSPRPGRSARAVVRVIPRDRCRAANDQTCDVWCLGWNQP